MIATLRESKAKLSELVERAAGGEEVLITVRGRPKVRLIGLAVPDTVATMEGWARELEASQVGQAASPTQVPSVLDELREERW
jgi:prevent-host-death family protein